MDKNEHQLDDFFGIQTDDKKHQNGESLRDVLVKKLSIRTKLRLIPKVLSVRERYSIFVFLLIILASLIAIPVTSYFHYTEAQPDFGGSFIEGILGKPHLINPLLSQTNDADRDLTSLIYSGLLKYNEKGQLVPDLAKSYEISEDGLSYTVFLRENLVWHDGTPVTADDILFTIQTAKNPDYGSLQRVNWQGVDVELINNHAVMFRLKNKYAQFLNNLTVGILPRHLWQDVKPINFTLYELNLRPIGSGPYKFERLKKDKLGNVESYILKAHEEYHEGRPYIDTITIKFFDSEDTLIEAYNKNEIESIGFVSAKNIGRLKFKKRLDIQQLKLPRYFAMFFNQSNSEILSDKNIRLVLNHAIDKNELVSKILDGNGVTVNSPMIINVLGQNDDVKTYEHDRELAENILTESGWDEQDKDGVLLKGEARLSLSITTSTWPELVEVATIIKEQLSPIGIDVTIETLPISQLQRTIKDRSYEILLFGEILNVDPDPFSLWHSSQKHDPGLNLALYDNKTADTLLEEARQTLNLAERMKKYDDFQQLVIEDIPVVFLYSPFYVYAQTKKINGFNTEIISMPSDRFVNIVNWYIKTKRVFKD
jgi:peptide/nickel transport system substrate-binding protein